LAQEAKKILRKPAVLAMTGYSNSTLYQKIADGKFPAPIKLDPDGRVSGWLEDEIAEVQARAIARRAAAAARSASLASTAV
jgi:prophage regulatory protein